MSMRLVSADESETPKSGEGAMQLDSIEDLVADIRAGRMVILMDDEDRENEGDLIMAASQVRAEDINFMATHARGLICLTLTAERCEQLRLPLMVNNNGAQHSTNFTVSIEAAEGVTTGISAADRAYTARVAVAVNAQPEDLVQPGHIFPLMAQPGGVLRRAGHTEAGCDLSRLAGQEPAAVIVEIMNEDGSMARRPDLEGFAQQHDLKIGTIADLIAYRMLHETTVECIEELPWSTEFGEFRLRVYRDHIQGRIHFALVRGDIQKDQPTLVRVHLPSTVRDLLHAQWDATDNTQGSGWNLQKALARVAEEGCGVVVVLSNDESSDEILDQLGASQPDGGALYRRPKGVQTYPMVGTGSQILRDVGVGKMRLLSSPMKFSAISGFDLEIVEYIGE